MKMRQLLEAELVEMSKEQERAELELLEHPNVVGVGLGNKVKAGNDTGQRAIQVLVSQKLPIEFLRADALIAPKVGKYSTDVIDVGEIFAQLDPDGASVSVTTEEVVTRRIPAASPSESEGGSPQALRNRLRPVMGGFSVGHTRITAGTIATACYDETPFPGVPRRYYILSNNHVLANSNSAAIGDAIVQPGPIDGGTAPADVIGRLARFVPIRFHTPTVKPLNFVDAAIAEVQFHEASREIYWIGYLNRRLPLAAPPLKIGDVLQKTGRTTNFTTGRITTLNATLDVNYGGGRVARFANQIVTTAMSAGGDSGSLVTDLEERAVGLLFAGSPSVTILNPISFVQALLKIRLTELP